MKVNFIKTKAVDLLFFHKIHSSRESGMSGLFSRVRKQTFCFSCRIKQNRLPFSKLRNLCKKKRRGSKKTPTIQIISCNNPDPSLVPGLEREAGGPARVPLTPFPSLRLLTFPPSLYRSYKCSVSTPWTLVVTRGSWILSCFSFVSQVSFELPLRS